MSEHDEHRKRVYRRFRQEGLAGFEEHNALEMLLFLAKARGDTNSLAHTLISRFGSFAQVLDASEEELLEVPGIGEVCAVAIKLMPQLCAYYLDNKTNKTIPLNSVEAVTEFFMPKFFAKTEEEFYLAAVDDRRKLLRCVLISKGISNATSVSIAKVVATVTRCGATGVILAHNHPRGITLPSGNDIVVTRDIFKALQTVNVELLDHLIFCDNDYLSFASTSYLATIKDGLR